MHVKGVSGNSSWIKLPRMYGRTELPVGKEDIATPDKLKQWDYLKVIASDITQTDGIKVGLLIGANFMKALESLKVILSVDDDPYAYQTRLGWCIVGPILNMVDKRSVACNRAAVIDTTSSNISSHHFVMEETMKEVSLEEMFQIMYKNDFKEASTIKLNSRVMKDAEKVSSEDKRFLQIVEEKMTKAGEHYIVSLPFQNESLDMANNRKQAIKRLTHLKDRFKRNPSCLADYKNLMDHLITKGYAIKEDTRPPGKTWFIPHHGVYHPNKSGKIRVVFGSSAEFDERSLNKELLTGPDLTNQIVVVLTRFRQNSIAFMADIEAMHYQMMVLEHQQTFIKHKVFVVE